ncbi:MAG: hypothetical protein JWO72_3124 [Caulobacteraceae bacterium]|nr:hypothetical protein [Caulobacteraceae bacterium]
MSLTFPRAMPLVGVGLQIFEPTQVGYETATAGGDTFGVVAGYPRWRAQWTLASTLTDVQSDQWRAFLASLKNGARSFFGYDVQRPFPRLYAKGFAGLVRAGGGAFDGSLTSWSQSIAADGQALVTLGGLPAGFLLSVGDYADLRWTTSGIQRRALVRSLEDAVADGSGIIAGVSVEPPIPAFVPGTAVAHLDNPSCVMRLDSSQTQVTEMDRRGRAGARIAALQDHHK